jgi:5'-deoxynucleotidase YfbR-like HD superfamily hydrolase
MDTVSSQFQEVLEAIDGDVRRLDSVIRFSSIPTIVQESVSAHSFWVAFNAALIHRVIRPEDEMVLGAVVMKAIVHDLAECVTGDVVRTFKYSTPELRMAIEVAEDKLVADFAAPIHYLMRQAFHSIHNDHSQYISGVVKAADFMSLLHYMKREVRRGNREVIHPYYIRMEEDLNKHALAHSMTATHHCDSARREEMALSTLYSQMREVARTVRLGG